jgi:hypothetical protein
VKIMIALMTILALSSLACAYPTADSMSYKHLADGLSAWNNRIEACCTDGCGAMFYQTITAGSPPSGKDSDTQNKIKFSSEDVVGDTDGIGVYAAEVSSYLRGDLDHNGVAADSVDVAMMIRASVGDITPNSEYDRDHNGVAADSVDVAMMIRASVGDITL